VTVSIERGARSTVRSVHSRARKQPPYLSRRPAAQLWWSGSSEPCLQLHRDTHTLWPVLAKTAMHQCCLPEPHHLPGRTSRQRARGLVNTPEFAHIRRRRTKWEALFAELKNQIGLHRLRLRRLRFVREQSFLAAAQNIKRLSVSSATGINQHWRRLSNLDHKNSHYRSALASKVFSTPLFQHPLAITLTDKRSKRECSLGRRIAGQSSNYETVPDSIIIFNRVERSTAQAPEHYGA